MKVEIQTSGFRLDKDLRQFVHGLIDSTLGERSGRIERLRVKLAEVDDPRDGRGKSCQVQVSLRGRQRVITEIMNADIRAAILGAFNRSSWTVSRSLRLKRNGASNLLIVERHVSGYPELDWAA